MPLFWMQVRHTITRINAGGPVQAEPRQGASRTSNSKHWNHGEETAS